MKKINVAIVGCGYWGPNFVRNFSQMHNAQITAICDVNNDKTSHLKKIYENLETYNDFSKLIKNPAIDAVVISTPASTHYSLAKEALKNGKHVLVEKPISTKNEEAQELIELSQKSDKILMVGHTFLYNPAVRKMKEIIDRKALGKIFYIHCRRTNLGPLRKDVNAIWDLSPHDISIINYLLASMPYEVSAYSQKFLSHKLADVGFIILKYPKNVLAHIHVSWLDPKKIRELTIIGSKKMLVYEDTNLAEPIRIYDKSVMKQKYEKEYDTFEEFQLIIRDGEVNIPKVNMQEPLKLECQHFIDSIINKTMPTSSGQDGLNVLKVLEAINKSINNKGEFVKI